ncbi:MAG TPA: site-specific tyrosine recombinase XerD [Actinobacteria bacterium]|nr:site-specific tyrosine recombinase XerD [Actinomycetota bacterium]
MNDESETQKNARLINEFKDFLKFEKMLSDNTINSYSRDILIFFDYLKSKKIKVLKITYEEILELLENLHNKYTESTISRMLSTIRTFYRFALRDGFIKSNPFNEIKNPKKPLNLLEVLDENDVNNFLNNIPYSSKLQLRDRAMFELIYSSGLRVSEIVNLKLNDIDYENSMIRFVGKGNKERIVPIGKTSQKFLLSYIKTARPKIHPLNVNKKTSEYIFLNKNGNKLTRQGFWKILKNYEKKINPEKKMYPHLFRHSFATHLLQNGADLRLVQELLGHSSISTTQIYTNINKNFIKESFFKNHPRNKKSIK